MTGLIMGIEVRRSAIIGITLVLLVAGLGLTATGTDLFAGRWTQWAFTGRAALVLLIPGALAGGAWLGRRDRRHRVNELFSTAPRPRWQRLAPLAVGFALALTVGYLLMLLPGVALVAPIAGYFPVGALPTVAVGVPALIAAGWLGMAAGRAVPRIVTAPVLAVVGFVVTGVLPQVVTSMSYNDYFEKVRPEPASMLLNPVTIDGVDEFQVMPVGVSALQTGWLVAVAVTGFLLLAAASRRVLALAVLPGLLAGAAVVPLLPTDGYSGAAQIDATATELVCDTDGPPVCVRKVHAALLPDVVAPARQTLRLMAEKLPNPPNRAVQSAEVENWALPVDAPPSVRNPADDLVFDRPFFDRTGRADLQAGYFAGGWEHDLLSAGWRQACGEIGTWYRIGAVAEEAAAAWLTDQPPTPRGWLDDAAVAEANEVYQELIALPEAEQQRRMGAAREAALDCRMDDAAALITGEQAP
ncbi:hypothetical protein JQS43_15090 [Natronosporangium hydrolyticum]|uniref:Uncharacterized protein n=1 Tax=Natronosporangium hydrolyticum TaxID=2811111 RepID=A0A895Y9P2_9ACTN|nr:hypothetical protein [Natronosporangium hydrolyticum]QSB12982.1 hypothetical protein JQS43_15090 [Natronosporangium hydrolyticum]